jgi:hypothetical protein
VSFRPYASKNYLQTQWRDAESLFQSAFDHLAALSDVLTLGAVVRGLFQLFRLDVKLFVSAVGIRIGGSILIWGV